MKKYLILLTLGLVACGGATEKSVSKNEFGDSWPLTVDSGVVECLAGSAVVFKHDGITYQLNGQASNMGYTKIDPIWKDNPALAGTKINIAPLIKLGLGLCK